MPAADPNRKDPDFAEWRKDKTPFDALISTHLAHARYGSLAHLPGANNGQPYIFAQGNLSTTIPTHANPATYSQYALFLIRRWLALPYYPYCLRHRRLV